MIRFALASLLALLALPSAASAALSTTHSGWLWGAPEPQGNDLYALELQGARGYAGGAFGTLVLTTDGGSSWSTVRTGLTIPLTRLEMIDEDSLVVGSGCELQRTDDGGATFRRVPFTTSGCARPLAALSFPTASVGYLLLADGGVLKTTDGGESFAALTNFPTASGQPTALAFSDPQNGVAGTAGGDIYRTVDGGASWTREHDGDTRLTAVFIGGGSIAMVGDQGMFLVSNDGGDTWTRPTVAPDTPPGAPNVNFTSVRCVGATGTCLMATGGGRFVRTTDGGKTFEIVDAFGQAADFASATRAVGVGLGGRTLISDGGGRTWTTLGSQLPSTPGLFRVRATSASVAHAIGLSGAIARTGDGGETWTAVGVPTGAPVRDVSFPTANVGYALDTGGGLAKTDDGGLTWSILDQQTRQAAQSVFAVDDRIVLLIGPRGMYRSTDGGESFSRHRHKVVRIRTLTEGDRAGTAVMVFGPRVIAVSRNNGATWRRIVRPTQGAEVLSADFVSAKVGYVLETDGRVYSTRTAGKTWTELTAVGHSSLRQIAMGGARSGWLSIASGSSATVLRTSDGGRSWRPQLIGQSGAPILAAPAARTGFAVFGGVPDAKVVFTQSGGDAGAPSSLTISTRPRVLPRPKRTTISGRLRPAQGGEVVEVRVRSVRGTHWRRLLAAVSSDGTFSVEHRVRRDSVFVAQWAGEPDTAGDGSPGLLVRIDRSRR